jgi:hypothetical protein
MATELYSLDKGLNYSTVTKATGSATTKGMELTIDLAKFTSKKEVLLALDEIKIFITRDVFKPA